MYSSDFIFNIPEINNIIMGYRNDLDKYLSRDEEIEKIENDLIKRVNIYLKKTRYNKKNLTKFSALNICINITFFKKQSCYYNFYFKFIYLTEEEMKNLNYDEIYLIIKNVWLKLIHINKIQIKEDKDEYKYVIKWH